MRGSSRTGWQGSGGLTRRFRPSCRSTRPKGLATRAIVTEYELPWTLVNIHDVSGDAEGNIWFNINRSPFLGKLEPETGKITRYRVPDPPRPPVNDPRDRYYQEEGGPRGTATGVRHTYPPGVHPGLHWMDVDHNTGRVWFTNTWGRGLGVFDPSTGEFQQVFTGMQGNVNLSPDGLSVWRTHQGKIQQF